MLQQLLGSLHIRGPAAEIAAAVPKSGRILEGQTCNALCSCLRSKL